MHVVRLGVAIGLVVVGLALTYNFLAFSPAHRLGGHRLDLVMFFGPSIVAAGILLASGTKFAAESPHSKTLYYLALVCIAIPVGLLVLSSLTMTSARGFSGIAGMLGVIAVVLTGLPGLVLLAWSSRIRSWFY